MNDAQVALGIVLACSEELLGMRDMEAMVDLLRFGVPQWRHERLQARCEAHFACSVQEAKWFDSVWGVVHPAVAAVHVCFVLLVSVVSDCQQKAAMMQGCSAAALISLYGMSVQSHPL